MGYVVAHPAQRDAAHLIALLLHELHGVDDVDDLFEFQRELAGAIYDIELQAQGANRQAKRVAAGRTAPEPPGPSWSLERHVFERIARQLRCVGDAMAWRLFNFDRRVIVALSQNQPSGHMFGKEGLGHELGAVVAYHDDGKFALLHSVTNCLRIADLTVFEDDMPRLQEIKASPARGSRYRAQKRRAERAIAVINEGALLGDGEAELFRSTKPLKTAFRQLRDALSMSARDGYSSVVVGRQHVITTWDLMATEDDVESVVAAAEVRKRRAFARAELVEGRHLFNAPSVDAGGHNPAIAPPTVFPLTPEQAAAITVDFIAYDVAVGWDRLAAAFEVRGFHVEPVPFPPGSSAIDAGATVMSMTKRDRRLQLHNEAVAQLLLEFLDLERYVDAVAEYADRADDDIRAPSGLLTFSNERAIWR